MPQILVWAILASQLAALISGAVVWFKQGSANLFLAGAIGMAMAIPIALGDSYPVWRYSCQAVGLALVVYTFIRLRKVIRWRSAPMVLFGMTIVMIVVTELLADVVPGVPRGTVIACAVVLVASFIASLASMGWEVGRLFVQTRQMMRDKRRELGR